MSVGSYIHECAIFFKKVDESYHVIYFNPNYSMYQQGVERSNSAHALTRKLRARVITIRSSYSPGHNLISVCRYETWKLIHCFLVHGLDVFDNTSIKLENYRNLRTPYVYQQMIETNKQRYKLNKTIEKNLWDASIARTQQKFT